MYLQIETRKEELETNLSTNLVRRQQELEAIILSADSGTLPMEADLKRQELEESNEIVHELTKQRNRVVPIKLIARLLLFDVVNVFLTLGQYICRGSAEHR